uniref:GAF domain-containing protein n=1 Tax=Hyaloperonospora arabidopsidis (strain Emoy2) TaxID=559515 RepID=M4B9D6_HYAAE
MSASPSCELVLPDQQSMPPQAVKGFTPPTSFKCTADPCPISSNTSNSSSSQLLADLLEQVPDDEAKTGQHHAALTVLAQLLLVDHDKTQMQVKDNAHLLREATASCHYLDIAKVALDVSKRPSDLAACEFAGAASCPSSMTPASVKEDSASKANADQLTYPIPLNENERVSTIEHLRLHDIADVPELNVICALASAELNCPHSVLTLVERDIVTLLATNAPETWKVGSGNAREQTFCQHFVMQDQPFLVDHAEADERFRHIAPVKLMSLQFYTGFPVSVTLNGRDGEKKVVVGALCCMDETSHEMTRSQYWRLMKLADAASEILEKYANEHIAM